MAVNVVLVAMVALAVFSSGKADDSWDPQMMLLKSVTECREKFPDLELARFREYIQNKDIRLKCFLDCLFQTNGILSSGHVVESEGRRWLDAAADTLTKVGIPVDAEAWRTATEHCLKEDYADGDDKCSGAVKLFMCYLEGFPQKEN